MCTVAARLVKIGEFKHMWHGDKVRGVDGRLDCVRIRPGAGGGSARGGCAVISPIWPKDVTVYHPCWCPPPPRALIAAARVQIVFAHTMIVAGLVFFIEPTAGILGGMALSLLRFAMNMSAAVSEVVVSDSRGARTCVSWCARVLVVIRACMRLMRRVCVGSCAHGCVFFLFVVCFCAGCSSVSVCV